MRVKCNNCEGRGYKMLQSTNPNTPDVLDKCECMICNGTGLTYRHEDDNPSPASAHAYWEHCHGKRK